MSPIQRRNESLEVESTVEKIKTLDRQFKGACRNIMLLNQRIEDKQVRYNRAYRLNQRTWRYTLRLQLATLEGMRNMFYEYARRRADELDVLRDHLVEAETQGDLHSCNDSDSD